MANVVDQLENPPSFSNIGEHDELLCPKCGDLFKISGYKVTMVELSAWKLAQSRLVGSEISTTELMEEKESELSITPD